MDSIRVVLFTEVNSKLGSPFLSILHGHPNVELAALVTSPPGKLCAYFTEDEEAVDVADQARALGVRVLRPRSVNDPDAVEALAALEADYFLVGNFQQLLKAPLLALPRRTAVNFHPSPLPEFAGLAPFYWMVREGAAESSVSAIEMGVELDDGDLLMQHHIPLSGRETGLELRTMQERANVLMLLDLIPHLVEGTLERTPQDLSRRSYYGRPRDEHYRLDFGLPAAVVERHVRAAHRHPGAWFTAPGGQRIRLLSAAYGEGGGPAPGEQPPGTLVRHGGGLYVACADGEWLRLVTVECGGREVAVDDPALALLGEATTVG
ncbi:formyltransferase family protein [Streptomyces sp. NPDC091204]|uniref:methionyl-tRNA formyltransferase n=1 Tax=Streptomyces sp. NPDC091204 TaxID=3155299 RepID=UPI003426F1F0